MSGVGKGGRYPDELRERAVRMVFEHQAQPCRPGLGCANAYEVYFKGCILVGPGIKIGIHEPMAGHFIKCMQNGIIDALRF